MSNRNNEKGGAMEQFQNRIALFAASCFVLTILVLPLGGFAVMTSFLIANLAKPWARALAVPLILVIGILAFRLRVKHRCVYGLIEMSVALFAAWYGLADVARKSPALIVASFIASVYFVARGLENATHGRERLRFSFFGTRPRQTD